MTNKRTKLCKNCQYCATESAGSYTHWCRWRPNINPDKYVHPEYWCGQFKHKSKRELDEYGKLEKMWEKYERDAQAKWELEQKILSLIKTGYLSGTVGIIVTWRHLSAHINEKKYGFTMLKQILRLIGKKLRGVTKDDTTQL